jgi:hypothetical protein
MKNFNLCHFTLILFSFICTIDSHKVNAAPMTASHTTYLAETGTVQDIDPDWRKLIGYIIGNTSI